MRKNLITGVFKKSFIYVIEKKKIAHLNDFYDLLGGFKRFYKSEKSFKGAIRATLQSFSKDCNSFGGNDLFASLDKNGFWMRASDRHIQGLYKQLKDSGLGKYKSVKICMEYL